jgi:tetratricopeptide (TPR) repeat protein
MILRFKLLILFSFLISSASWSQTGEQRLNLALESFNRGAFSQTLNELDKITSTRKEVLASSYYLRGLSHSRLQQFTRAANAFQEALKNGNTSSDIFYELGQALYARNNMNEARSAFIRSYQSGHMRSVSLYYMGHISQILAENDKAIRYYDELLKEEKSDLNLRQIARFQRGESTLMHVETKPKKEVQEIVEKFVLPELEQALAETAEGNAVGDITRRIQEIKDRYNLDPSKMLNGRPIPAKKLTLNYSQKLRYDDNITLANDQPTVISTLKDSYILDSSFFSSYQFHYKRRVSLIPELRISKLYHLDRDDKGVYTNDRQTFSPGLRTRLEYKLFGKMAALLFRINHDYTQQDRMANKSLDFFSRTWTTTIGQRFQILPWGETTIQYRYKTYRAWQRNLDNDTHTFSIDQVLILPNRHLLILLWSYDDIDNFNNPQSSTANMLIRGDYIISNILPMTNLNLALSYAALDTKLQSQNRGTEPTWNPSIKVTRRLSPNLRLSLDYAYSKKTSLRPSNEYDKQVTTFELRYDY